MEYFEYIKVGTPIILIAVAWGVMRQKVNGHGERLDAHSSRLEEHIKDDKASHDRMIDALARLETQTQMIYEEVKDRRR